GSLLWRSTPRCRALQICHVEQSGRGQASAGVDRQGCGCAYHLWSDPRSGPAGNARGCSGRERQPLIISATGAGSFPRPTLTPINSTRLRNARGRLPQRIKGVKPSAAYTTPVNVSVVKALLAFTIRPFSSINALLPLLVLYTR